MNTKLLAAIAAVVVLLSAGVVIWQTQGDDSSGTADSDGPTFVVAPVERRDITDELSVRGEIRRDELQRITSGIDGRVSSVEVTDGDTIVEGDVVYALDGRAAVAVRGEFSFFRQLDVGSDGPDVFQLERILADAGYQVGIVDLLYTEDTRRGLRDWQIDHGYGGATPEPDENIVISLAANPSGYRVGAKNTVSIRLGPSVPTASEINSSDTDSDEESLGTTDEAPEGASFLQPPPPVPAIEVSVAPPSVTEGDRAVFTFTSDIAMPADTVVGYSLTGSALPGTDFDDTGLDGTFVFAAGATSFDLEVRTLEDDEIETDEVLTVGVSPSLGATYTPGPLREASLTITGSDDELAEISVTALQASTTEGGRLTFRFDADRPRNEDTTIFFRLKGSARNGLDYTRIDPREVVLPAGATSVNLDIQTQNDTHVESDESVVVELNTTKRRANYTGGNPVSASAIILADPNDLPELTIQGGGTIGEGEVAAFTVTADQAVTTDTSINYHVSGSATPGRDYQELSGTVVMAAGQRSVSVGIRSLDDDVVFRPGDMIVADWPARVGTVAVDEGEFILLGQEVLTLTEPEFTITMVLSPTDRGQLAVGMVTTVELQASDQGPVDGFISELDDNATVDAAGNETYEGTVETADPMVAVDGAGVNIDVILDQRVDVITVPVAAVLQNGEGDDVVRVVLTDGTTRQVRVSLGLSEGAFVEVESGLSGDELVLVET